MQWYGQMGRRVWSHKIAAFLRAPLEKHGPALAAIWGASQDGEEQVMSGLCGGRSSRPAGLAVTNRTARTIVSRGFPMLRLL